MEPRNASAPSRLTWRIQNVADSEADVYIDDVIGDPWFGTSGGDFAKELRELKDVTRINLHINSPGGVVKDGLQMYNAILQHPAEVVAYIESEAASAASFVAQAANKRVIARNAKIFIHDAQGFGLGNAADFRALADMLDEESNNIADIYATRAGGTVDEWRDAMRANDGIGSTYRGQAAVDAGLADEVMTAPARNVQPGRVAAQTSDDLPEVDAEIFKQITARGYEPPMPSDISRLIERNMAAAKEATNG